MLNREEIKKEVYKNEKNKLTTKILFFNIIILFIISISLSNTNISNDESKILNEFKEKTIKTYQENDSLKKIIFNEINDIKTIKEKLIKKTLNLSFDTTYNDINPSSVNDIYIILKNEKIEYNNLNNIANTKLDSILNVPDITPISSSDMIKIASPFGYRKHPIYKKWIFHEGIDISAKRKMDVFATSDGIIENIYKTKTGYGNRIIIKHKYGYKTVYAHLNTINVKKGQIIKKNDKIGTVGSTGTSTNNHLHYEILINNRPVDPLNYIYAYVNKN